MIWYQIDARLLDVENIRDLYMQIVYIDIDI